MCDRPDPLQPHPPRPEHDLLPWMAPRGLPAMAYSPVEQGRLVDEPALVDIAADLDATAAQVALAWLLARDGVIAIPKAGTAAHVRENHAAADLVLAPETMALLDAAFPPPTGPVPLEML